MTGISGSDDRPQPPPFPDVFWRNAIHAALEVPAVVKLLAIPPGKRVLLAGCGRGIALPTLADLCAPMTLTGIDISGELLAKALDWLRDRSVQAQLVQGDVQDMPFRNRSFDIVIDFGACYHIPHPGSALREIARVLDRGGIFVYETRLGQLLSHPLRSFGRGLCWNAEASLVPVRTAALWATRVKR